MTVWVEDWQMQCCGQPFAVGSTVSWTLRTTGCDGLAAVLGERVAQTVDAVEEHHGRVPENTPETKATVTSITAVHCRYAARAGNPRDVHPVPGSAVLSTARRADGYVPKQCGLRFIGYLVKLTTTP
jgi:hypothetical protein